MSQDDEADMTKLNNKQFTAVQIFADGVKKVNSLSLRERSIIAITISIATIVLFLEVFWVPGFEELEGLKKKTQQFHNRMVILTKTIDELDRQMNKDLDLPLRTRNAQLQKQLLTQEKHLVSVLGYLVKPEEIVDLLQQVFLENDELKVLSFESLPVRQVFGPQTIAAPASAKGGRALSEIGAFSGIRKVSEQDHPQPAVPELYARLYSHGVKIELEAGFFAILDYLRRLEALETSLLFNRLEYQVEQYPKARVTLTVETIGLEKEWLGV